MKHFLEHLRRTSVSAEHRRAVAHFRNPRQQHSISTEQHSGTMIAYDKRGDQSQ